jgi:drug/metabolite transporter (DMT)-like permease
MNSTFLIIAIIAYSLFAINGVIDKFLLSKAVRSPAVYAFFIGITGPLTFILVPFTLIPQLNMGFEFLTWSDLTIAIAAGASFVLALYYLYKATKQTSVSRILPIEGGLVPVFTLFFAYTILGERLLQTQLIAFAFLVGGAVIISLRHDKTGWHAKAFANAAVAAMLFALSFVLTKYTFDHSNFISGLVWSRLGFFAVAVAFLLNPKVRHEILNTPKETSKGNKFLYLGGRISGSLAGFLQNYAISLGSVTIVNAMQGTQYALLLVGTIFLSKYYPQILKEKITLNILLQKIFAILLISLGLIYLTR